MNVLITGGAGYLGTELTHALAVNADVSQIVIYDNLSRGQHSLFTHRRLPGDKVRFVHADVLDQRRLKKELASIDVVYHLAARVSTPFEPDDPHSFEQINHWGSAEVASAIESSHVDRLIYTSSAAVYGFPDSPVTEYTRCSPMSHYGIAKHRGEQQIARLSKQLEVFVVRCANVYGYSPAMRFDALINRLIFEANFYNRVNIYGNGKQTRACVHVERAVQGLNFLLNAKAPSGIYNLVDDNFSVLDVAMTVKEFVPKLEFNFVDQHMPISNLLVSPQTKLAELMPDETIDLKRDLKTFADNFSFSTDVGKP